MYITLYGFLLKKKKVCKAWLLPATSYFQQSYQQSVSLPLLLLSGEIRHQ